MPNMPSGMGAIWFCHGGKPKSLEIYTFGSELSDGVFEGFSVKLQKRPSNPTDFSQKEPIRPKFGIAPHL